MPTYIHVSKCDVIGSDNGLSPVRHQAIIWTNTGFIVNGILGNKLQWNFDQTFNIFIREKPLENVVCKVAVILFRPVLIADIVHQPIDVE